MTARLEDPIDLWPVDPQDSVCVGCGRVCVPMADHDEPVCHRCDDLIAWVGVHPASADLAFPGGPAAIKDRAR